MRLTPALEAASPVVSAGNPPCPSPSQHGCWGQGAAGITQSPCPQENARVGNIPPSGSGRMDWPAPGDCRAPHWPGWRCEADLPETLQERTRLALPPRCQQGPGESGVSLPEPSAGCKTEECLSCPQHRLSSFVMVS